MTGQTTKIKERAGASSLAFAIADIVKRARGGVGGPVSRRGVFIGAVLGAYAAVSSAGGMDQTVVAILGAIGGAIARLPALSSPTRSSLERAYPNI